MSNEELLKHWMKYVDAVGPDEAFVAIAKTKKVSPSTAVSLSEKRYHHTKPSKRTREALHEALFGKKAS